MTLSCVALAVLPDADLIYIPIQRTATHSIGATMLEYPAIGAKSDARLEENMIFSLHPQVVDLDGKVCLYTQDTYRIGKTEGECLADVPWKFFTGSESRSATSSVRTLTR